ncbi:MAG: hypothetical protein AAGC86_01325 [Pseudomonadota bacterium]
MEILIWIGAAVSLAGVAMLFFCIFRAVQAKRAGLPDAELKMRLKSVITLNLAALMVSALGLICVILGIFLS